MTKAVDRARTVSLARAAVSALAPEELSIFDSVSECFVRDFDCVFDSVWTRDDMFGFGIDVVVLLLTLVVVVVAVEALRYVGLYFFKALCGRKEGEILLFSQWLIVD